MSKKPKVCIIVRIEDDLEAQIRAVCEVRQVDIAASRADRRALGERQGVTAAPGAGHGRPDLALDPLAGAVVTTVYSKRTSLSILPTFRSP